MTEYLADNVALASIESVYGPLIGESDLLSDRGFEALTTALDNVFEGNKRIPVGDDGLEGIFARVINKMCGILEQDIDQQRAVGAEDTLRQAIYALRTDGPAEAQQTAVRLMS